MYYYPLPIAPIPAYGKSKHPALERVTVSACAQSVYIIELRAYLTSQLCDIRIRNKLVVSQYTDKGDVALCDT